MPHQIVLQQFHLIRRQRDIDVPADPGVHAVNALPPRQHFLQPPMPQRDASPRRVGNAHRRTLACHRNYIFNRERPKSEIQSVGHTTIFHSSKQNLHRVALDSVHLQGKRLRAAQMDLPSEVKIDLIQPRELRLSAHVLYRRRRPTDRG